MGTAVKVYTGESDDKGKKAVKVFNPYGEAPSKVLDRLEKSVGLSDATLDVNVKRMSTGILCLDLVLGGGLTAGWYTNVGKEQCCKTTLAIEILISSLFHRVPFKYVFDYEGSTGNAPQYVENIAKKKGMPLSTREIFGEKDNKGEWIHKPKIRYRDETVAERFFDFLSSLLRRLPEKRMQGGQWYYIYNPEEMKGCKEIVGSNYDESYFKKTGRYRVPAEDGSLQAIVLVDSYPNMLPERLDVDDPSAAMAAQATMFAAQLRRVKGRLQGKRVAVIGINAIRMNPGARFGNPEYETGGEALKTYSDVRLRLTSRALSAVQGAQGKGYIEEEKSVSGEGKDKYRYIHARAIKNKFSTPDQETFLRLWVEDENGEAWGFDPVFDTYEYLRKTGQLKGTRKSFRLGLIGKSGSRNVTKNALDWGQFKQLILGDKDQRNEVWDACKIENPVKNLRAFCEKQIASGQGTELYFDNRKNIAKEKAEDGDDGDDAEEV